MADMSKVEVTFCVGLLLNPANTRHWRNVGLLLGHRLRRRPNNNQHCVTVSCLPGTCLSTNSCIDVEDDVKMAENNCASNKAK